MWQGAQRDSRARRTRRTCRKHRTQAPPVLTRHYCILACALVPGHRLPTPIISFETHQIYCLRNGLTGAVVEGDEDDIRAFHYLWALQPNEESDAEHKWQVTELAVRGVMQVY